MLTFIKGYNAIIIYMNGILIQLTLWFPALLFVDIMEIEIDLRRRLVVVDYSSS